MRGQLVGKLGLRRAGCLAGVAITIQFRIDGHCWGFRLRNVYRMRDTNLRRAFRQRSVVLPTWGLICGVLMS